MSTRRSSGSAGVVGLVLLCILFLAAGCSERGGGGRFPNKLPDTQISFGPVDQSTTYYKVQAFWYGTDDDGNIDHYEVSLVKNLTRDSLPSLNYDALSWAPTARTESSFVLTADSCCTSIGLTSYGLSYWGILVRAVDNDGGVDPVPAGLFFQASNALPRVRITIPKKSTTSFLLASSHVYLEWRGEDIDGDAGQLSYKYLVIPETSLQGGSWGTTPRPPLPPLEQDSSGVGHASPPTGYWSEWVPADCTYVKDLNLSLYAGTGKKIMAFVTCKDEGGAILPDYLYGDYASDNNWVRLLISLIPSGVTTMIDAGPLGVRRSLDVDIYKNTIAGLFRGTPVSFKIWGLEDRSQGNLVTAYRYYYDDPEDPRTSSWNYWTSVDPLRQRTGGIEWTVKYPPDGRPFEPTVGPHVFVAELRDLNKVETHCEFRIEVLPGPEGKDPLVYLVDDDQAKFMEQPYANYEQDTRIFWTDILDGYNWEWFDTREGKAYTKTVPIRRVGDATTVIWVADWDYEGAETQLLKVCWEMGNYLNSYVKVGGNLIIIGKDPCLATMYWPDKQVYSPSYRSQRTNLDFTPRVSDVDSSAIYNFMWEAFGILKMQNASPAIPFRTMAPCEAGWEAVTTDRIPGVVGWPGKMDNAFYITEVRNDIDVHKMYSMIPVDNQGLPIGSAECSGQNMKLVGVYVPGDGERGYAAYIGVPPWFFDHDQVKVMIRKLLEMFGEPRTP